MAKEDTPAMKSVMAEYDRWSEANPDSAAQSPMLFFGYLNREQPHLLTFKTNGADTWQIISGWLQRTGRMK